MNNKNDETNRQVMRDDRNSKPGLSEKMMIHTLYNASGINTNVVSPINEVFV